MKFAIGTAQFIKKYGILKKKIRINELKGIFRTFDKKIDLIDTAPSYNNAELIVGQNKNYRLKIATKLNYIDSNSENFIKKKIINSLEDSLIKLKTKNIFCLYIHDERNIEIFKKKNIKLFFNNLKKKQIKNIGITIYNLNKLEYYLKIYKFDIIQIPLNVLNINRKIINKLKYIKKKFKVKIYVRSIFAQGLLLEKKLPQNEKFNNLRKFLQKLNDILIKYNCSNYNFCISILDHFKLFDYLIIGINNKKEFFELKKYKKTFIKKTDLNYIMNNNINFDLRNFN